MITGDEVRIFNCVGTFFLYIYIYSNLMYIAKIYNVVYFVVQHVIVVQNVIVVAKLMWSLMWSG